MKRSISIAILFAMLMLGCIAECDIASCGIPEGRDTPDSDHRRVIPGSVTPHSPIVINSDSDFSGQGWPGNGLLGSPYIIEGLSFTADAVCISITNTTVYFEIRECVISPVGHSSYNGIVFTNVTHGTIWNCTISHHTNGIYLLDSENCTLVHNTAIDNSAYGFHVTRSGGGGIPSYCTLDNNTAISNADGGFYLKYSDECNLVNNTATEKQTFGFNLWGSCRCLLIDNIASDADFAFHLLYSEKSTLIENSGEILYLDRSDRCNLTGNSLAGIHFDESANCILAFNTLNSYGMSIEGDTVNDWIHTAFGNTVTSKALGYFESLSGDCINGSQYGQVILANCTDASVEDGIFNDTYSGVLVGFCTNCTLRNNTGFDNSVHGFSVVQSENCTLTDNTVSNSGHHGFYLSSSNNCTLTNNTATDNLELGFYLQSTSNCTLENNTGTGNYYAFDIQQSSGCTLTNNTSSRNAYGVYLHTSERCTLRDNSFLDKGIFINGENLSHWSHDISFNTVHDKALGYFKDLTAGTIDGSQYGLVILVNCSEVVVSNGVFENVAYGVQLSFCTDCSVEHGFASGNTYGFSLFHSDRCLLLNSTTNNSHYGFHVESSEDSVLTENTACDSYRAFYLSHSDNFTIINNTATQSSNGFELYSSSNCTLVSNTATYNSLGFLLSGADDCTLKANTASDNTHSGFDLTSGSEGNILYLNRIGNNSQYNARDNGDSNTWDDGIASGNYWMDYTGIGVYSIYGSAGSVDRYPLIWDVTIPLVNSPADIEYVEGATSRTIIWAPADANPESYVIYRNGTQIKSGKWNSSTEYLIVPVGGLEVGVYNYTLVVTDIAGNCAIDTVLVIVYEMISTPTTTTMTNAPPPSNEPDSFIMIAVVGMGGIAVGFLAILLLKRRRG